ncbi:anthrone oxygenase family protein [Streptomyces sp. NPDC046197]|uniref:anthrone oxygenase family protein n=1 Tax=Streptomyces sp. NPDC046197 TaxID=3154337 RepID=UPI0034092754
MAENENEKGTGRRGTAGAVLGAATVTTGLVSGVFYVFACAVMPALARSDDRVYVQVMRNIDDVIQNPVFFPGFFGALLLTGVSAWQVRRARWLRRWVWAALTAYAPAFLVTVAFNVPLNDALAATADPARAREHFENPWVAWNVVRTLLSTCAAVCLARGLVLYGRGRRQTSAYFVSAAGSSASR